MSVELPSMSIERIREALAAGPTPGPWTVMPANAGEQCVARINAWESVPPNGVELAHDTIDAAFIAACHPAAIRELLAERDALKAESESLREMLAHLYAGPDLYSDDGELQDASAEPFIDFKRDSVADIRCAMVERNERKEQR